MPRWRIYIMGPYTAADAATVTAHVTRAMDAGIELAVRGYAPYIPHLTHFLALRVAERQAAQRAAGAAPWALGPAISYEDYLAMDDAWLQLCDGALFLAPSPGALRERARCTELGVPVFDTVAAVHAHFSAVPALPWME